MSDSSDALKLIDKHVKENPVIIFMKGTPSQPQCGFSAQSIRILNAIGVEFASVNVLDYPSIREGIKAYS
jgi:monothiol glutaredoxin